MARSVVWCCAVAAVVLPAVAEGPGPWAPFRPSVVLERPFAEVLEQKGAPATGSLDASQARYRESWFNLPKPIDVDYLALTDAPKTMHQITLHFPADLKRDQIVKAVNRALGKGEQGPSAEDAPSKYYARWIRDGVRFELQDFGDYIEMYVTPARLDDPVKYGLPELARWVQAAPGNVVEDEDAERVLLVGIPGEGPTPFMQRLYLIVQDGGDNADIVTPLPEEPGSGYDPEIILRDFTGDALVDVFFRAGTGGSGGIYNGLIYSFAGGVAAKIFDTTVNAPPSYTGALIDGYKATLSLPAQEKTVELDLSDRKALYDELGVYRDGVVAKPTELWGEAYGWLAPVDKDEDKVFELRVVQQVRATSNADRVAEIASILNFDGGEWKVIENEVEPLPAVDGTGNSNE